jgi:hypothetical protein
MSEAAAQFRKGDFVRLKRGVVGSVGVVWRIQTKNVASVMVYWRETTADRIQQSHKPKDLELVPVDQAPEYATELKRSLGL